MPSFEDEVRNNTDTILQTAQSPEIVTDTLYQILTTAGADLRHRYKVGGFLFADLPCLACQLLPTWLMDRLFLLKALKPNKRSL